LLSFQLLCLSFKIYLIDRFQLYNMFVYIFSGRELFGRKLNQRVAVRYTITGDNIMKANRSLFIIKNSLVVNDSPENYAIITS